jgi:Gentisate 1,2-dioxygenase
MEVLRPHLITAVEPCLWKWTDVYDSLVRAGEVISLESSERRVVRLVNPGLNPQQAFATHTIQISFQYVKPGENARAHRHTPAALRLSCKATALIRRSTANSASWSRAT